MEIEYSKKFLKELSEIEDEIKVKIESIVFIDIPDSEPFSLGYIEKMQGYKDKYKIRVGHFRIGLTINKSENKLSFERVAHRKDIYKIFP